jgi:hypothetical protein
MTAASTTGRLLPQRDMNDRYLVLLVFSLLGYAVLGKGFAYAGIPPLFIGEIVLGLGLVALLRSRCLLAAMGGLPSFLLVALMGWVVVRTIPYVAQFGIDAVRDSMVALYGLFAFIMIGLYSASRKAAVSYQQLRSSCIYFSAVVRRSVPDFHRDAIQYSDLAYFRHAGYLRAVRGCLRSPCWYNSVYNARFSTVQFVVDADTICCHRHCWFSEPWRFT